MALHGSIRGTAARGRSRGQNSFPRSDRRGGGLDLKLTHRWGLRAGEVDYYLTRFDNGSNDHQNNLPASAGVFVRF
jgi:hypothetical protein